MNARPPIPAKQTILRFCYFLLLVQAVLAHSGSERHSRIARAFKHTHKRSTKPRQTKFSYRGIFGIRANEESTAKIGGTFIGIIPDAGDTGGRAQTMQEIIKSLKGKRPACFGWYAQVVAGQEFTGSQLFEVMDDLKKCKCVFTPAIMPQGGWAGLTWKDNSQAVRIAKVLRKFTDENIAVALRFGHEANWYQRTGEYPGSARDFKEAWAVVAKAVRDLAPDVLLHWTPNVSTMAEYKKYAPDNMDETVDIVGLDYYPKSKPASGDFVKHVKEFHDTFAINGIKFAMGESGLHYSASYQDRVSWLVQMASSKAQLPNLIFINWYNSQKEFDYKIAGNGLSTSLLTEKLE